MKSITLYNSGICNLNCKYCFISKNPGLQEVDKEIDNSFKDPDYYINFLKELFSIEEIKEITRLDLWGAEPLLNLERIFPFVEKFITVSENFSEIFFSTNFAHKKVIPSILNLYNFLKTLDRKFLVTIQISCDGPEDITDYGRGINTTKYILENVEKLLEQDELFTNDKVTFHFCLKPTLDRNSFPKLLDYDYNIYYYKFFEDNFLQPFASRRMVGLNTAIPNFAVPAEYTQEDGFILRDICKTQRKIEKDNLEKKYFDFYKEITLFSKDIFLMNQNTTANLHFGCENIFCGYGYYSVGLLPNHIATGCHRSFSEYNEKYNDLFSQKSDNKSIILPQHMDLVNHYMIFDSKEKLENYREIMKSYQENKDGLSTSLVYTNTLFLMNMAKTGLVDKKYFDMSKALVGVKRIIQKTGICINDNLLITETTNCVPSYKFKLFCNGALDYIYYEKEV